MDNKSLEELIPHLECVRCGSKEGLVPYTQKKIVYAPYRGGYKTPSTEYFATFPLCMSCHQGLLLWEASSAKKTIYFMLRCILFIAVAIGFIFVAANFPIIGMFYLFGTIGFFITCIVMSRKSFRRLQNEEMNPENYIIMLDSGQVFVNPLHAPEPIPYTLWLQAVLKEHFRETIISRAVQKENITQTNHYCWNCGSENQGESKFCGKCGEALG